MLELPTIRLDDPDRLAALDQLDLLDTPAEDAFDRLTRIATRALAVPVSLVSLIDSDRQFFKSCVGLPEPWATRREAPLSHSFCQYVVGSGDPLYVSDARLHPLLKDNLAIPDLGFVAYVGVPLFSTDGQVLGALCATDNVPRDWSSDDISALHDLAETAMLAIHQRRRTTHVVERWDASETAQHENASLLDRISDAFYALDRSWRFVYLNSHCEQLLQRPREELLGRCVWDEFPEATETILFLEYHRALDSGIAVAFELFYPALDTWFEVRVYPAADGLSVYFCDVSERRRSEASLRAIIDASPLAIMAADQDGIVLMWNPTAERLFGWAYDDVIGKPIPIMPASRKHEAAAGIAAALRGEQTDGFETQRQHKDGSLIDVSISSAPIRDAGGAITGSMAMYLDIREQKQDNARMLEAERTLQSLIEQSPNVLYRTTPESLDSVTYISPQYEAITGWTTQEVIELGDRWFDTSLHPDDIALVRSTYRDACASGEPFHIEYRLRTRAGSDIWVQDEALLVRDEAGTPLFWHGLIIDISRGKRLEEELRHQASHDALTGLPNRFLLVDRTERAMARSRRGGAPAAVLFLDLDHFKVVNDSLGHGHGDAVLVEVARRLTTTLRDVDTIARFGGDEFAILLDEIENINEAIAVAERVRSVLEPPVEHADRQINLTTSIGVALFDASVEDPEDLLRRADVAMYRAKVNGRNRIAVFDAILHQIALHRLETETDLRRAVEEQQFELHFQPKVILDTGDISGFEALVRWNHPTRGLVAPAEFIPLAEESGLIVPLGQWILETACRQAVEWRHAQPEAGDLTISVNLAPRQFQQADLVEQIARTLQTTGLEPARLTVEITETAVMEDIEVTVNRLNALKALGVKIAIDDFGIGYSSLSYLKRFPLDVLKIDRSFVSGLGVTPVDTAIVKATITLAHTLGITVVAEGVETRDQRDRLLALDCDRAQGYYFSKPIPAAAVEALIASHLKANAA